MAGVGPCPEHALLTWYREHFSVSSDVPAAVELASQTQELGRAVGSIDFVDELFSDDVRYYLPFSFEPVVGREGVRGVVAGFRTAFPDLNIRIEDLIEEGDKLAARVTASGTNKGELMGSSPTGRAVTWSVVHLSRLDRDRIAEDRVTFNVLGFLQQLGLAPPTAA